MTIFAQHSRAPISLAWPLVIASTAHAATFSAADVAKHATRSDCWISIDGKVYDITSYIDTHPVEPGILVDACGKDASVGWRTKGDKDKPHSRKAAALLKTLLKGQLAGP